MAQQPLADKIRPDNLNEFIGQKHLVGQGKPIRLAIEQDKIFSMIFWGPPGCGKTTLARIIANETKAKFIHLSAVSAKKEDIRKIITKIRGKQPDLLAKIDTPQRVVLFLDEIHRFNKAQQDYLLPFVEEGTITLIGATTENPSFEVISPLLSRCRVFTLNALSEDDMAEVVDRAVAQLAEIKNQQIAFKKDAKEWLIGMANGDARQAVAMIENTFELYGQLTIKSFKETLQSKHLRFDKKGEEHYNTISAYIKSMRASDPDAALYYLARMVDAGEDPLFIARRMVIFASEDIGMAQPTALVVANEVFRACETIGYPECAINLAHGTVYLATADKDRSAYNALRSAQKDVKDHGNLPIPLHLRNAPTQLMKDLDYGKGYDLPRRSDNAKAGKYPDKDKNLLPDKLKGKKYFKP
jgi:putative ATPase